MWSAVKKFLKWSALGSFAALVLLAGFNWTLVQRLFLGGLPIYESTPPQLPAVLTRPAVLVFSKTNSYRHEQSIAAAGMLLKELAARKNLGYFATENGAAFSEDVLRHFDLVIFSNVTGDVLTPEQKTTFETWLKNGGAFIGIHGAGDRSHKRWPRYVNDIIGAAFVEKAVYPPIQTATVRVDRADDSLTRGLPPSWQRVEEWYSFDRSVRTRGSQVLLTVDEKTYNPRGLWGQSIRMGADHPVAWTHCFGNGRVFYTPFGHRGEAFSEPEVVTLLSNAIDWSIAPVGACRSDGYQNPSSARK